MDPSLKEPQAKPYQQTADEALAALGTDAQRGLSEAEARARLERHGPNELKAEKPVPAWRKLLAQFADVLVILLLVATGISAALWLVERESALPFEAMAIFANGERRRVPAAEIVPGDLILLEEGDTVPADARLIQSTALNTAEAALTGESLPVCKDVAPLAKDAGLGDRHNMIFSGTAVTYGRGKAVVTATGMHTEMGRIAGLLEETPSEITALQKELDRVGKKLGVVVVVIAVVMIGTILLVEDVRGFSALFDVLILGVALAVAAVPEGLPAVVTAVLSLGVQRMAGRNAIVRHLAAVETLGSANVIASAR